MKSFLGVQHEIWIIHVLVVFLELGRSGYVLILAVFPLEAAARRMEAVSKPAIIQECLHVNC